MLRPLLTPFVVTPAGKDPGCMDEESCWCISSWLVLKVNTSNPSSVNGCGGRCCCGVGPLPLLLIHIALYTGHHASDRHSTRRFDYQCLLCVWAERYWTQINGPSLGYCTVVKHSIHWGCSWVGGPAVTYSLARPTEDGVRGSALAPKREHVRKGVRDGTGQLTLAQCNGCSLVMQFRGQGHHKRPRVPVFLILKKETRYKMAKRSVKCVS